MVLSDLWHPLLKAAGSGRGVVAAVAILALALTTLTYHHAAQYESRLVQSRFESAAHQALTSIEQQFRVYSTLVSSGVGLVNASDEVSEADWAAYVRTVRLQDSFPGLRGLALVQVIPGESLDAFTEQQRADGRPWFRIQGADPTSHINTIVTYVEPGDANTAAIGLNSWSVEATREVMTRSVENAAPTLSRPLHLAQANPGEIDLVIYAPVFRRGAPIDTIEQRWAALCAFVAAPLKLHELLDTTSPALYRGISIELESLGETRIAVESREDATSGVFESSMLLKTLGHGWELHIRADRRFINTVGNGRAAMILWGGIAGSFMAAAMAWSLVTTRARAESLAEKSVQALLESTLELRLAKDELERRAGELDRARAAAETASAAKTEFLANMSHEIRTPITAVIGFADLLSEDGVPAAERSSHVSTIQNAGRHLLAIVNNVLDLSKIEAGEMAMELTPTDARAIAREVTDLFSAKASAKGITLGAHIAETLPGRVQLDSTRFRQILVNLIGNAVKFTDSGGVTVTVSYDSGTLRCAVRDTGIGLSSEQIAGLFRPFAQADASMSRRFGGTGLGLVISRRLCEMLGGSLDVESAHGAGSCFTATLSAPAAHAPAATAVQSRASGDLSDLHILIVEDGPDNRRLLTHILRKAGARCQVAENGAIALAAVQHAADTGDSFAVILMDMQMPVMDGYTATRTLRERGFGTPIIALTAHAMAEDRQRCLDAGCDDYATKPFDRAQLIDTLARLAAPSLTSPELGA